jgi:hypothetical protein
LSSTKKGVEDIAEAKAAECILATHVVLTSLTGIAKHFVSMGNQLESLVGLSGVIYIWV